MLTPETKDWLAENAGIDSCFSSININYIDPDNIARTGSTGDVLNAFVVAHMVGKDNAIIIANTNYSSLKSINNNQDIAINDIAWVYSNDGTGTESRYCIGVAPVPIPIVEPLPEKVGVFVFKGPIVGEPSVILNLSELQMRQAADAHFEMNGIKITNTSDHPVYLAIRIRLFAGELPTCPDIGFVFDGMDKTTSLNVRVKTLEVNETAFYNADFYQPATILGMHTICMLIHGAWSRADLLDEVEHVPG